MSSSCKWSGDSIAMRAYKFRRNSEESSKYGNWRLHVAYKWVCMCVCVVVIYNSSTLFRGGMWHATTLTVLPCENLEIFENHSAD